MERTYSLPSGVGWFGGWLVKIVDKLFEKLYITNLRGEIRTQYVFVQNTHKLATS